MMSVASCDQASGTPASVISKTTEPSGLAMRLARLVHVTESNGLLPCDVNFRVIFMLRIPKALGNRQQA